VAERLGCCWRGGWASRWAGCLGPATTHTARPAHPTPPRAGADDYAREDEDERAIQEMFAQAQANLAAARAARAAEAGAEEEEEEAQQGPSSSAAAAAASGTTLQLGEGDEALFDDDDDGSDLDDDALEELEGRLAGASVGG
jgi:hypothetical protein